MENFTDKLYKGLSVLVDYKYTNNSDIIDWFEDSSNFEGWATITSWDDSYCFIEDCPYAISLEYIITLDELD